MTSYYVQRGGRRAAGFDHALDANSNLFTGEKDYEAHWGPPTTLESDLLLLASAIFAADRATRRGEREDIGRHIHLSVPVVNVARLLPLKATIEKVLRNLSNDRFMVDFRPTCGEMEDQEFDASGDGRTVLFSGGLDSMAAAVLYCGEEGQAQLVSHVTRNARTRQAQDRLVEMLAARRGAVPHSQFFVSSRGSDDEGMDHDVETSQRTRSFVFMTLGALAARRAGHHRLVLLAENGQMAIHLPLTSGRIGAFSTHTAHPDVLAPMEDFLSAALDYPIRIENPFVHLTKAEVVRYVLDALPEAVPVSESCWRNARPMASGAHHCGECVPCYVRRVAIERHGTDGTMYNRDPWAEDFSALLGDDLGRRNLADLAEFVRAFELYDDEELMAEWPELYSQNVNAAETIAMYRRFAGEAREVWTRYPGLATLLE